MVFKSNLEIYGRRSICGDDFILTVVVIVSVIEVVIVMVVVVVMNIGTSAAKV